MVKNETLNLIAEIWCKDISAEIAKCGREIDALKNQIAGMQRAQGIIEACARENRPLLKQAEPPHDMPRDNAEIIARMKELDGRN